MAKGISLHIGVDEVDPNGYPLTPTRTGRKYVVLSDDYHPVSFDCNFKVGWVGPLSSCELDAVNMQKLAKRQKFNAKILKTKKATTDNVTKEIRSAAKKLVAGDTFLVSYSGHGSQVEDLSGDEADGEDETWCLYDRMFLDDEQRELYAEFARGVNIVVMSDCCHSGSSTRAGKSSDAEEAERLGQGERREMEERTALAVYRGRKKEYDQIQRGLKNPPPKLKASRIMFSACQDYEHAMGYDDGGVFTVALLEVWNGGNFKGSYRDLAKQIRDKLQRDYNKSVDRKGGDASRVFLQVPNFVQIRGSSNKALEELTKLRALTI
jgi:hypothetical protein